MTKRDRKAELTAILARARNELSTIEANERVADHEKLIGKCFKYRNNYSAPQKPSDYWWMYTLVIGVERYGSLKVFEFQTDKHGAITIEPTRTLSSILGGHVEIKQGEFDRAWQALQARVAAFPPTPINRVRQQPKTKRPRS